METDMADEERTNLSAPRAPVRKAKKPKLPAKPVVESKPTAELREDLSTDEVPVESQAEIEKRHGLPDHEAMEARKKSRKPFGEMDDKLYWPEIPGWKLHWFNDVGGRILQADEAGYVHILDKGSKKVNRMVGTHPSKPGGLTAYLMAIPIEWYEENQAAENALLNDIERDLHKGEVEGAVGEDGRYVPQDEATGETRINIEAKEGRQRPA